MWEGGDVWILGGGPSLPREFGVPENTIKGVLSGKLPMSAYSPYMSSIHDKHVIGVNMAFKLGDWVDMVFWGDKKWFLKNRKELANFTGLKVTCHPYFEKPEFVKENVKAIQKDNNHSKGISSDPRRAAWNANSGGAAISVAANAGANRIILVGFDMKLAADNSQHWHSAYRKNGQATQPPEKRARNLPFTRHLLGFPKIALDARRLGITIINACPDSAIQVFPKMSVSDVLDDKPVTMPVKDVSKMDFSEKPPKRRKHIVR